MIIRQERLEMSVQRPLAEDNYMIQTLPPKGADHAFYVSWLPGRARSRKHFLDAHGFHIFPKLSAEDAVPISPQIPRNLLEGKASRSCCMVHSAVGWAVTLKCKIRLRS